jgi:hypothetical protein
MCGIWVPRTVQDFYPGTEAERSVTATSRKKFLRSSPYDVRLPAKSANWKQYQSSYLC